MAGGACTSQRMRGEESTHFQGPFPVKLLSGTRPLAGRRLLSGRMKAGPVRIGRVLRRLVSRMGARTEQRVPGGTELNVSRVTSTT